MKNGCKTVKKGNRIKGKLKRGRKEQGCFDKQNLKKTWGGSDTDGLGNGLEKIRECGEKALMCRCSFGIFFHVFSLF